MAGSAQDAGHGVINGFQRYDANNLVAPYTLSVGQKLIIPAP